MAIARSMPLGAQVSVTAVVTAENGRLGTPGLIGVGDDSGGIAVRLPRGVEGFPRGSLLEVHGTVAAPYGQVEIRAGADGVRAIGSGLPPAPDRARVRWDRRCGGRSPRDRDRVGVGEAEAILERRPHHRRGTAGGVADQGGGRRVQPDLGRGDRRRDHVSMGRNRRPARLPEGCARWLPALSAGSLGRRRRGQQRAARRPRFERRARAGRLIAGIPGPGGGDRHGARAGRSPGRDRGNRDRAVGVARRDGPANRRPGRVGGDRSSAADRCDRAPGRSEGPGGGPDRPRLRSAAPARRTDYDSLAAGRSQPRSRSGRHRVSRRNGAWSP